jgi:hypothetical protein
MQPFEAYKMYTAISLHFTSPSYDYFKYGGAVKTSADKFETRNDKFFFHKLSKIENLDLFLANAFLRDTKVWVGNLFDEKYIEYHKQAMKRKQSLQYVFKSEMSQFETLDQALNVVDGDYPPMLTSYKRNEVSAETLLILNSVLSVFDYWDNAISDKVIWPKIKRSLMKYNGFIKYDKTKYNEILFDMFN